MQYTRIKYNGIALIFISTMLWGQTAPHSPFSSFDIYIYPEYSHPGVGIVVEGVVLPGEFPRLMTMEVPGSTTIALVRIGDAEGQRIEIFQRDGKAYLPVDITGPNFQVQYFYNPFEEEKGPRAFEFIFSSDEQLGEVHFIVQKPLHAENFMHTLPDAEKVDGDFGLVFFREHKPGMAPGERHSFTVSYNNPDGTLSATIVEQMQAVQQATGASRPDAGNMGTLLLVTTVLGASIFGVMKLMNRAGYIQSDTSAPEEQTVATNKVIKAQFCSSCGTPRRGQGKYCHQCGKEF